MRGRLCHSYLRHRQGQYRSLRRCHSLPHPRHMASLVCSSPRWGPLPDRVLVCNSRRQHQMLGMRFCHSYLCHKPGQLYSRRPGHSLPLLPHMVQQWCSKPPWGPHPDRVLVCNSRHQHQMMGMRFCRSCLCHKPGQQYSPHPGRSLPLLPRMVQQWCSKLPGGPHPDRGEML